MHLPCMHWALTLTSHWLYFLQLDDGPFFENFCFWHLIDCLQFYLNYFLWIPWITYFFSFVLCLLCMEGKCQLQGLGSDNVPFIHLPSFTHKYLQTENQIFFFFFFAYHIMLCLDLSFFILSLNWGAHLQPGDRNEVPWEGSKNLVCSTPFFHYI